MTTTTVADDVTVVIRSVGERTVAACRQLLAHQVREENIITVSNAPLSATLADCFRAGMERDLRWTLCIDADVLVCTQAVALLLQAAAEADEAICELQGLVLDKFFGVRRPAGNHLYRTSLLPKALSLIPAEGENIRPEFHTLNKMAAAGHPWVQTPLILGLHDFEQSHADIFRKCFVHANKHEGLMHLLVAYWRRMAAQDEDFRVALMGLAAGIAETGDVRIDVRRDCGFADWVSDGYLTEKAKLTQEHITPELIDRTLATWPSPGPGLEQFADACAQESINGRKPPPATAPTSWREAGLLRVLPWTLARLLGKAARKFERMATR